MMVPRPASSVGFRKRRQGARHAAPPGLRRAWRGPSRGTPGQSRAGAAPRRCRSTRDSGRCDRPSSSKRLMPQNRTLRPALRGTASVTTSPKVHSPNGPSRVRRQGSRGPAGPGGAPAAPAEMALVVPPRSRRCRRARGARQRGAAHESARARGPRRERGVSAPAGGLSRRIHLWAWAGRRGRVTQSHGMCRARVSAP